MNVGGVVATPDYVEATDSYGWHVVLEGNLAEKARRMLCVEFFSEGVSGFFRWLGARVSTIDLSDATAKASQVSKAEQLCQILEAKLIETGEAGFDVFVLHDLRGQILNSTDTKLLRRIFHAVNRLLSPDGYCYLGLRNAKAFFDRQRDDAGLERKYLLSPAEVRVQLVSAGFDPTLTLTYPYLLEDDRVLEVLSERGYVSVKDSTLWRERVKEWCYGRYGAAHLAPGYGIVACKQKIRSSLIDAMATRLGSLPETDVTSMQMMRCQVVPGAKVFLSFGSGKGRNGRYIVVYTCNALSISRREEEAELLRRMAPRVPELALKLPRVISTGNIGVYRYFVISEFSGMTIDRVCPGAQVALRNAAGFLIDLHRLTANSCDNCGVLIARLFRHAVDRYPVLQGEIMQLADIVLARWPEHGCITVWQHGDYKLENLIVDPKSFSVVGVIDWELSCEAGLPLLDMLHLIAYSHGIEHGLPYEDIFCQVVLSWRFSSEENALLDEYLAGIGYSVADTVIWAALYLIHDIGIRRLYTLSTPGDREILETKLRATLVALGGGSGTIGTFNQFSAVNEGKS